MQDIKETLTVFSEKQTLETFCARNYFVDVVAWYVQIADVKFYEISLILYKIYYTGYTLKVFQDIIVF